MILMRDSGAKKMFISRVVVVVVVVVAVVVIVDVLLLLPLQVRNVGPSTVWLEYVWTRVWVWW